MFVSSFLSSVENVVADLTLGKMCIVTDSVKRENEGDLIISAKFATPDNINFMLQKARGMICVPLTQSRATQLGLELMPKRNNNKDTANFTLPVDATAMHGVTTGISCYDRAKTIEVLLNKNSSSLDFISPGHVFPLIASTGGLIERPGHTEASIELMKIAGLPEVAVICELVADNGRMMQIDDLILFAEKHNIRITTIDKIIHYIKERVEQ